MRVPDVCQLAQGVRLCLHRPRERGGPRGRHAMGLRCSRRRRPRRNHAVHLWTVSTYAKRGPPPRGCNVWEKGFKGGEQNREEGEIDGWQGDACQGIDFQLGGAGGGGAQGKPQNTVIPNA